MFIKKIELTDFRNYKKLDLEFNQKVNIFLGKNAQGKTNLLEAIYMTSLGKSFKTAKDNEMIFFGEDFCRIKAEAEKRESNVKVEIIIGKEKKAIKVDDIKIKKISELLENIYTVAFTPEDLKIVKDEPEKRRKFIDRELCQLKPSYYSSLFNYKKVLHQRNAYLKEKDIREDVLEIWDIKLAEYGSKVIFQRDEFIKKLNKISAEIHEGITNNKESLKIQYESNIKICEDISAQKEYFEKVLRQSRTKDLYQKGTTKGPHKDDIVIFINDINIRNFGSQGQQRTAALSLKLAELQLIKEETDEEAILLLDDVLSELDSDRQKFLINFLKDVQLFITTTEISENVNASLPAGKRFNVSSGTIDIYKEKM